MFCALILYVSGETYSLTSTPNDRFLRNFVMAGLVTLRVFARNLQREEIAKEIYIFFHISFWCLTCDTNPGFMSNKPTHHLLYYDNFFILPYWNHLLLYTQMLILPPSILTLAENIFLFTLSRKFLSYQQHSFLPRELIRLPIAVNFLMNWYPADLESRHTIEIVFLCALY